LETEAFQFLQGLPVVVRKLRVLRIVNYNLYFIFVGQFVDNAIESLLADNFKLFALNLVIKLRNIRIVINKWPLLGEVQLQPFELNLTQVIDFVIN